MEPIVLTLDHDSERVPDWKFASECIQPKRGICVVEMLRAKEKIGGIYLPTTVQMTHYDADGVPHSGMEPSIGVVLQSDEPFSPGQMVLVVDGDGLYLDGAVFGPYKAESEVRIYGRVHPKDTPDGYIEDFPLEESIVAIMEGTQFKQMTKRNVLLRRDPSEEKSEGGIWLPDNAKTGPCKGTVVMSGPMASVKPGETVLYHPEGCCDFADASDPLLRIVDDEAILVAILAGDKD